MFLFLKRTLIVPLIRGGSIPKGEDQTRAARQIARVGKDGTVSSKFDVCSEFS